MKLPSIFLSLLFTQLLVAQNQLPQISNVQTTLNANEVIINYDLMDAENDEVEVTFRVGVVEGVLYDLDALNVTGDIGMGIIPGMSKTIIWDWTDYMGLNTNFRLMLVADDHQAIDIQEIVDQVDSTRLYDDLILIEGVRHRTAGAAHLESVKQLLVSSFESQDLELTIQGFDYQNYHAENIIGRKAGTESEGEVYIVDGHFDSVASSPGADDNGSAVAGVLEVLRVLSPYAFKKTIRYIGFDLEETGLNGSAQYVANGIEGGETINGVLNFEMIGYYSEVPNSQMTPTGFELFFPAAVDSLTANDFRGDFITVVADENSFFLSAAYQNAIDNYVPDLRSVILDIPVPVVLVPDLTRSDHASFWFTNRPAIMLTDGANFRNPNYHSVNDKIETLNFTFMSNVVKAAIGTLAEMAEIQHATTFTWETDFPTSVSEPDFCKFQIYPNPANNQFQIRFADCRKSNSSIQVFDLQGKKVYESSTIPSQNYLSINSEKWQRGVFMLHISNGEKQVVEKLILN